MMKKFIWPVIFTAAILCILCAASYRYFRSEEDLEHKNQSEEIYMVIPTYGYVPEDMDLIFEEMNKISIEKCNIHVNYILTSIYDMETANRLRLEAGEQIDLMPCMGRNTLHAYIKEGTITPLDDLLETYAAELLDIYPQELWPALEKDSKIYAVAPLNRQDGKEGLNIREDVLRLAGIQAEELLKDYDCEIAHPVSEIDQLLSPMLQKLAESSEALPDGTPIRSLKLIPALSGTPGLFDQCCLVAYEGFGNDFGGIMRDSEKIVNLYESAEYRDLLYLEKKWQDAGYIYQIDHLQAENTVMVYGSGKGLGFFSPTSTTQEAGTVQGTRSPNVALPLATKELTAEDICTGTWVIPQTSAKKEDAAKILNLMFTDTDYISLFINGIEGTHYEREEDGSIQPKGISYESSVPWMFGNQLLAQGVDAADAYKREKYSAYFGFWYEEGDYASKIAEMQRITAGYLPELEMGLADNVDAALKEMNQKLYEAGLEEVMRDKQRQLNEWIEKTNGKRKVVFLKKRVCFRKEKIIFSPYTVVKRQHPHTGSPETGRRRRICLGVKQPAAVI